MVEIFKVKDIPVGSVITDNSSNYNGKILEWTVIGKEHFGYPLNTAQLRLNFSILTHYYSYSQYTVGSSNWANVPDFDKSDVLAILNSADKPMKSHVKKVVNTANMWESVNASSYPIISQIMQVTSGGFKYGLSKLFLDSVRKSTIPISALLPATIGTMVYSSTAGTASLTTDFFLLSSQEMMRTVTTGAKDGVFFPYFDTPGNISKGIDAAFYTRSRNGSAYSESAVATVTSSGTLSSTPLTGNSGIVPACSIDYETEVYADPNRIGYYFLNIVPQAKFLLSNIVYPKFTFVVEPSALGANKIEVTFNGDVIETFTTDFTASRTITLPERDTGTLVDTINIVVTDLQGHKSTKTLRIDKRLTYEEKTFLDMDKEHTSLETSFIHSGEELGYATVKLDLTSTSATKDGRVKRILGGLN